MTDPGQNGNYNPFPQQQQYGQQQAPYGQQPQQYGSQPYAQYGQGPNAPGQKNTDSEEPRKVPAVSKVFLFIAASLMLFKYLILFGEGNTGAWNFIFFTLTLTACVLMILGLMIRKMPLLYGIGLLLFAGMYFIDFVRNLIGLGTWLFILMAIVLFTAFTLAGLYYLLKGKGINKTVKLIASILGITFCVIDDFAIYVLMVERMGIKNAPAFAMQIFLGMLAFIFIWIATLIFTPFGRKKH